MHRLASNGGSDLAANEAHGLAAAVLHGGMSLAEARAVIAPVPPEADEDEMFDKARTFRTAVAAEFERLISAKA